MATIKIQFPIRHVPDDDEPFWTVEKLEMHMCYGITNARGRLRRGLATVTIEGCDDADATNGLDLLQQHIAALLAYGPTRDEILANKHGREVLPRPVTITITIQGDGK